MECGDPRFEISNSIFGFFSRPVEGRGLPVLAGCPASAKAAAQWAAYLK